MTPLPKDIVVRRGDTKEVFFRVRERELNALTSEWVAGDYRDLTGWTALSQIRTALDGDVVCTFTPTITNQATVKGGVLLVLSPAVTAAIDVTLLTGVWDVQLTGPGGEVYTYIEGKVTFTRDVSR